MNDYCVSDDGGATCHNFLCDPPSLKRVGLGGTPKISADHVLT